MILSVSRRTDIPAFYTDWFFNRIRDGYVFVRNPFNYHQLSYINLSPSSIDCIVFWTKDPTNILNRLKLLKDYCYYFHVTINGYGNSIERNVPDVNRVIDSFKKLSKYIGKDRVIWRYDPIMISDVFDIKYHTKQFQMIASKLDSYTNICKLSFLDLYKKTMKNMKGINLTMIDDTTMKEIGERFSKVVENFNIKIETCAETIDLSSVGIYHGKCIDDNLISKITGKKINVPKDKNQRSTCQCVASVDIGAYNSCPHGCRYCYANFNNIVVSKNIKNHNPNSQVLIGNIEQDDKIIYRN